MRYIYSIYDRPPAQTKSQKRRLPTTMMHTKLRLSSDCAWNRSHHSSSASFQPIYRSGHPENYVFSLSKMSCLDQSIQKYFIYFEIGSTAQQLYLFTLSFYSIFLLYLHTLSSYSTYLTLNSDQTSRPVIVFQNQIELCQEALNLEMLLFISRIYNFQGDLTNSASVFKIK